MSAQATSSVTILPLAASVRVFLAFASGYFMSYALRSVNAMISPVLSDEFGLSHAQLGAMSAAYFLSFALLQLPLGIWLDRYGSRRVDASLLLVAAGGCAVFASASSVAMLWLGRAMIGVGVAGALMASLRAFRFWFAADRQQQLASWMLVAGTLGALVTTVPVQLAMPLVGWRGVFWISALLLAMASAAIYLLLPPEPRHEPVAGQSYWTGYRIVFSEPYFWRFAIIGLAVQSSFIAFQSLWIGPWFREVLGMDLAASARALFLFNLVLLFAYLALGAAAPHLARRGWSTLQTVCIGTAILIVFELAVALASGSWAWVLWFGIAIGVTVQMFAQSHVGLSFPEQLTGRAFTAFNLVIFAGMFAMQWLFGVVVDVFGGAAQDGVGFRRAMLLWVVMQIAAFLVLVFWRVRPPPHKP